MGRGEPGWDLGLQYTTLDDLISQLRSHRVYVGRVTRLAINCHGAPGSLRLEPFTDAQDLVHVINGRRLRGIIEGRSELDPDDADTADPEFREHRSYYATILARLRTIAQFLAPNATVLFPGCIAGLSHAGADLLRVLAGPQVLNRTVVGFTRILTAERQGAGSGGRSLPGARVTNLTSGTEIMGARRIDDPGPRPTAGDWASEEHASARIASPDGHVWSNSGSGAPAELDPGERAPGDQPGWGVQSREPTRPFGRRSPVRSLRRGQWLRDPVTGRLRRI